MIHIEYTLADGTTSLNSFPSNRNGNAASIKFLEGLKAKRYDEPWYMHRDKIFKLEAKIKKLGSRSKVRIQSEIEIKKMKADRTELLDLLGIAAPPHQLKITITHS